MQPSWPCKAWHNQPVSCHSFLVSLGPRPALTHTTRSPERVCQPQMLKKGMFLPSGSKRRKRLCWQEASVFFFLILESWWAHVSLVSQQDHSSSFIEGGLAQAQFSAWDSGHSCQQVAADLWRDLRVHLCRPQPRHTSWHRVCCLISKDLLCVYVWGGEA